MTPTIFPAEHRALQFLSDGVATQIKSHRGTTPYVILLEKVNMFSLFIQSESDSRTVVTNKHRDRQVG